MKYLVILLVLALCATPAMAYTNSTVSCVNGNTTLLEVISVDRVNSSNVTQVLNTSSYSLATVCPDGCDLNTNSCNPPLAVQYGTVFGLILFGCIGGYALIRWSGR